MKKRKLQYMDLPRELEFMFRLCLGQVKEIPSGLDWEYFQTMVKKNRIEPLVASEILKLPSELWKDNEVLANLSALGNKYAWISITQMQELAHVISILKEKGIRALSVKGPILALQLYGNPALRYSKDLDVLVDPARIMEVRDILLADGWEHIDVVNTPKRCKAWLKANEHISFSKGDVLIEVHDKMEKWGTEDFEAVWENHNSKMLMGVEVPYLSDAENVYLQVAHACGHAFFRMRWLIDLYRLFNQAEIDFGKLFAEMEEEGVFLLETLLLMERTKLLAIPEIDAGKFHICGTEEGIILDYENELEDMLQKALSYESICESIMVSTCSVMDDSEDLRKYLKMIPGKKKAGLMDRIVTQFTPCSIEWETLDLPDSKYWIYYLYRIYYGIRRKIVTEEK